MDRIELRGLRVVATHGVLPEEQVRAQPFEIDLDLELDLTEAGATDDLDATVDYGALTEQVVAVVGGEHHALLERLAERVAAVALADGRVAAAVITIRKLRPPVAADLASAGVTVRRTR